MLPAVLSLRAIWFAAALAACSPSERARSSASPTGQAPVASASSSIVAADSATILSKADRGRIRGDSSARLWLVMVSDFQCPYCRQWHDEVFATVVRDYVVPGKIRMAFVNLPLDMHANAMPAAEAAMCAGVQGRFWEMHDALFRTQARWAAMPDARVLFDSLATASGVAAGPFASCVDSHVTRPMIEADRQRVQDAGVQATPTFFLGNEHIEGAVPLPEFRAALDKAIAANGRR